ncbi:MAG: hypothetical protein C4523_08275 [Myxococcales bacterium]|nr:MAG: hypothetical protein C4523_08275 [Myxococcales bacterium]
MPLSLIVMALFCVILGGFGVFSSVSTWIGEEPDSGASDTFKGELEKSLDEVSPDVQAQLRLMLNDQELLGNVEGILMAYRKAFPRDMTAESFSFVVSLLSLAAGVGIFMRRDRARQLMMLFFVVAAIYVGWLGYYLIPRVMLLLTSLGQTFPSGMLPTGASVEDVLWTAWAGLTLLVVLLHGGIVLWLRKPSIRKVFRQIA